jgi:hypothetical protein
MKQADANNDGKIQYKEWLEKLGHNQYSDARG